MALDWPTLAQWVLLLAGALLAVPTSVLLLEVALALTARDRRPADASDRPAVGILVPAHDEALSITATIRALLAQLRPPDRLVVIADNCQDDTAAVARAAGAEVIERVNAQQRGKGFALDFGVRHLSAQPPPVLIVVDADCLVDPGSVEVLARRCVARDRPIQALYLMQSPAGAGPLRRLAEFAWVVRNQVRPLGLARLGLPCHLMGSGMAFPWASISAGQLASGHLVEDLELGIELAEAGRAPLFCPQARVTSVFPASREGISSQRTRWEHGYLSVLVTTAPRLLARALQRASIDLLALGLDLLVPPLALLVLLVGILWATCLAAALLGHAGVALALASGLLAALALAVLLAWLRFGRRIVSLGSLALAGVYVLAKVPLYVRFLVARQVAWVRSRRDGESPPPA